MRHEARTTHSFVSDDGKMAITIELEMGKVMTLALQAKNMNGQTIDFDVSEFVELASMFGEASLFLTELGIKNEAR